MLRRVVGARRGRGAGVDAVPLGRARRRSIPTTCTIATVPARVAEQGDPWAAMDDDPQSLEPLLEMSRARPGRRADGRAVAARLPEDAGRAAAGRAQPGAEARRVAVARLIYSAIASLDGYLEDAGGRFDWAAPDEEVHAFVNELERPVGTYLYGRRMYETMTYWEPTRRGRRWSRTSPRSGRPPTRSSTRARSRRRPRRGRGSSASSMPTRCGGK